MSASGVGPDLFRELLGRFATGVTILTTRWPDGRPAGMTANAVASVSLTPPLVLVCIEHTRDMHDILRQAPYFALNVLAAHQEPLSRRFAEDHPDRFAGLSVVTGPYELPLLPDVVAHILCATRDVVPAGDHTIFTGLVVGGDTTDRPPLTYFRSSYGGLGSPQGGADAHR